MLLWGGPLGLPRRSPKAAPAAVEAFFSAAASAGTETTSPASSKGPLVLQHEDRRGQKELTAPAAASSKVTQQQQEQQQQQQQQRQQQAERSCAAAASSSQSGSDAERGMCFCFFLFTFEKEIFTAIKRRKRRKQAAEFKGPLGHWAAAVSPARRPEGDSHRLSPQPPQLQACWWDMNDLQQAKEMASAPAAEDGSLLAAAAVSPSSQRSPRRRALGSGRRSQKGEEAAGVANLRPSRLFNSVSSCNSSSCSNGDSSSTDETEAPLDAQRSFERGAPSIDLSPLGIGSGIVSSRPGSSSAAQGVASQLRWLALRVRELEREASVSESVWLPVSPPSPRVSSLSKKDVAAAPHPPFEAQKALRRIAVSLEALTEDATHAAAEVRTAADLLAEGRGHGAAAVAGVSCVCLRPLLLQSCSWSSTATRQKQQLQQALEENERLVGLWARFPRLRLFAAARGRKEASREGPPFEGGALQGGLEALGENQTLSGELSELRAKYVSSERQTQQLLHCKQFQERFWACQRQIALLQQEMQTLHRTVESLEASHKAQEQQLQQHAEAEGRLKEALRATSEQLAHARQALALERQSSRAALTERLLHKETAALLPQRMLSHGRLFSGSQQQQQQQLLLQHSNSAESSSMHFVAAPTKSAPQPYRSLSMSRHSVLRCHLKTTIVQRQQQQQHEQQQQQQQQQQREACEGSGNSEDGPSALSPSRRCSSKRGQWGDSQAGEAKAGDSSRTASSSSCRSRRSSSGGRAAEADKDTRKTAAGSCCPLRSVSLFEELSAAAAGSGLLKAERPPAAAAADSSGDSAEVTPTSKRLQLRGLHASACLPRVSRQREAEAAEPERLGNKTSSSSSSSSSVCCCCCGFAAGAGSRPSERPSASSWPLLSPVFVERAVKLLLQSAYRSWSVAVQVSGHLSSRPYAESARALLLLSSAAAAIMAAWLQLTRARQQAQEGP
ncbi:hypothetical protein Efla_002092 [Eimeria flavescens]